MTHLTSSGDIVKWRYCQVNFVLTVSVSSKFSVICPLLYEYSLELTNLTIVRSDMTSALWKHFVDFDPTSSSWDIESAIALEYINSQRDTCLNIATESIARTDANTPTLLTIQQSKWMALSPPLKRITIAPWLASLVQEISSSEFCVDRRISFLKFQLFVHYSTNIARN